MSKAQLNMSIKSVVGLILGVIILLFLFNVGSSIFEFLFPDVSQLTEKSLSAMSTTIDNMQHGESSTFLFYMSNGHYLVAFDMGQNQKSGIFERPAACFGKSCLVICDEHNSPESCKNPELITTFEFDEINTIHSSKIVTVTQGEYVDLSIEIINNTLILNEV
ncbi:hypothetical protein HON86_01375 [Candidatus Woesearchaeota archaeon]|jgi:hypothetical protein|nr:hypothetical protein [Candidatus Woesearchaeota archaeon]MBT4835252.1 hypothetical protein [Candidatus Woesearchaeota archaeon]MBT6735093.1 hypothetical protein [Candidatus Woesearchaeota archaeon]MBT7169930.1 hypothetical protein [Candidatus Woesearchaeota archaeon]MBT7474372.1 hypothetical protein [Candidatus Woesearchaeota archaeon]